jgi:hypothetical protein
MAMLWAVAKGLPATMLPIPAYAPAAIEPNSSEGSIADESQMAGGERSSDGYQEGAYGQGDHI